MRTIALEEHYATTEFLRGPGTWLASRPGIVEPASDLGDGRIAAMDEAGVDLAVLSLAAPGVEQLDPDEAVRLARDCNDQLAAAVQRYPDRLAGFATVPISAPDQAAEELERAVRGLGFPGAVINGHSQGRYLDDPFFEPVLACAAALQAPIYLHPTIPPAGVIESCTILTMPANKLLAEIHNTGHRMPAILREEDHEAWLSGSLDDARAVLLPYPDDLLVAWPVSAKVSSVKNDDASLIEPVEERQKELW